MSFRMAPCVGHKAHLVENNLYFGERQDLSLKLPEFSLSGFDDSEWVAVEVLGSVGGALGAADERLELQQCPADRRIRECMPRKVMTFPDSVLYDCGENLAGWVRLRYLGKPGGEVRILHAETLTAFAEGSGETGEAGKAGIDGSTKDFGKTGDEGIAGKTEIDPGKSAGPAATVLFNNRHRIADSNGHLCEDSGRRAFGT